MARNSSSKRSSSQSSSHRGQSASAGEQNHSTRNGATQPKSRRRSSAGSSRRQSAQTLRASDIKPYNYPDKSNNKSIASRAVETVTEHPIPAILIGAGLTWLLMESRPMRNVEKRLLNQGRDLLGGVGETLSEYADTARDALSGVAGYVGESLGSATELPSRLGEYASEGASTVGRSVTNAASAVTEGLESGYEYTRETLADTFDRHPLAMCAAILGAGVAAGMLLPGTMRENAWMGKASDALSRNVRQKGSELLDQGRNLATTAAETVTRAVGLGGVSSSRGNNRKSNRNSSRSRRSQ